MIRGNRFSEKIMRKQNVRDAQRFNPDGSRSSAADLKFLHLNALLLEAILAMPSQKAGMRTFE